ncbi:MAG: UDP-N-acetylmuramoyl-L-alanine--D-glutamate ligase [Candidatus Hydromicrobium sp.]
MEKKFNLVKDKNLLVVGLGRTGISVIEKILNFCCSITGIDSNPGLNLEGAFSKYKDISRNNLKIILGKDTLEEKEVIEKIDLIIISPGVPDNMPIIKLAQENKIPVWSELELAWKLLSKEEQARTIAVTGTNGKTTVVTLIGKILDDSGNNCIVCGNVGLPLIETIDTENKYNSNSRENLIRVIEVSSFQLERIYDFKPHISVILNITSDHIDRHKSFKNYSDLKLKLLVNQNEDDWSIINIDDQYINKKIKAIPGRQNPLPEFIKFGMEPEDDTNIFYKNNYIYYQIERSKGKIKIENILLKGKHNISNIMASIAPAVLMNINEKNIEKSIKNFKPLEHRLEYLGYIKNIRCFNDSKSTNPDATMVAINDFGKEITLVMGGKDKDMDFSELISVLNKKVKNLILIGETAPKIYDQAIGSHYDYKIYKCRTLEAAVKKGFKVAGPGEVLMLSPACASMDMFKDYKERGNRFKSLVISEKIRYHGKKK